MNNEQNSDNPQSQQLNIAGVSGSVFNIGDITDLGQIMDITTSWKPEIKGQTLYYVTKTPEKYKKEACGIWKLGSELVLLTDR